MEKCPICADWCGPKSKEISRKKASKTAHELAEKEADIGIAVLEWEEVYALYFQKIYRHEYKRNLELEQEIELEESVKRNQNIWIPLHSPNESVGQLRKFDNDSKTFEVEKVHTTTSIREKELRTTRKSVNIHLSRN